MLPTAVKVGLIITVGSCYQLPVMGAGGGGGVGLRTSCDDLSVVVCDLFKQYFKENN